MLLRNDDVNFDTEINHFKKFCELCDKYGVKIIQAITIFGECRKIDVKMSNEEIINLSDKNIFDNQPLIDYLKSRNDLIGVHGLWHTHQPSEGEIIQVQRILKNTGFKPTYFVPPFNEGNYPEMIGNLKVSKLPLKHRLEDYLEEGIPENEIMYLHSWRFDGSWYKLEQFEKCLQRITNIMS